MRTPDPLCPDHPAFRARACIHCRGGQAARLGLAAFQNLTDEVARTRRQLSELAELRAQAAQAALDAGVSRSDLARAIGVSPPIITRMLQREAVA